jgi:glycosyltransferase involved in cell wall biosynthesis
MTPPFFYGGAEISTLTLAKKIERRRLGRCKFIGTYDNIHHNYSRLGEFSEKLHAEKIPFSIVDSVLSYEYFGMPCVMGSAARYLSLVEDELTRGPVGVFVTQLEFAAEALQLASSNDWPSALFVNDYLELGIESVRHSGPATISVYCSNFLRSRHEPPAGNRCVVLYPQFHEELYAVESVGECFTFINPLPLKGLELFRTMCELRPHLQFIAVQGWSREPPDIAAANVVVMAQQYDMRNVYSKSKALLVPSVCEEAFGRIVVEAAFSGIPSIASNIGGLCEAVGDGGILLPNDLDAWLDAIDSLLDREVYAELSMKALAHSEKFKVDWSEEFLRHLGQYP